MTQQPPSGVEAGAPSTGDTHAAAPPRSDSTRFQRLARRLSNGAGSGEAAATVAAAGLAWVVIGAVIDHPRWWELVVTVGLPIVTLLMVVLLQHTQNHDARATQLKLDELIRVSAHASNRMMTVEEASPSDLDRIQDDFRGQATRSDRDDLLG